MDVAIEKWVFPLKIVIFHSNMLVYQRVNPIKTPWNHHFPMVFPMVFLWNHHFPMVFLWFSHGFLMVFLWFFDVHLETCCQNHGSRQARDFPPRQLHSFRHHHHCAQQRSSTATEFLWHFFSKETSKGEYWYWLVVWNGLDHLLFSHIFRIIIPID